MLVQILIRFFAKRVHGTNGFCLSAGEFIHLALSGISTKILMQLSPRVWANS